MKMSKFCVNCGSAVDESAKFCPSCGGKIDENGSNGSETPSSQDVQRYTYHSYSVPGGAYHRTSIESPPKSKAAKFSQAVVIIVAVLFFLLIVLVVVVSHSDTETTTEETVSKIPTVTNTPAEESKPVFSSVSGTVGNWEITVNDFTFENSVSVGLFTEYRSSENAKFCVVNVTVKNIGKESDTFLPYVTFGNDSNAQISWNGYTYTRSELFFSKDTLSSEQLNPLVTATGDIVFDVPDVLIESDVPPVFTVTINGDIFSCELIKK